MRTRNYLSRFILLFGLVALSAETAQAAQGEVILTEIKGSVTINKVGMPGQQALDQIRITEGYEVRTGSRSSVLLFFSSGATVSLGANAHLEVSKFFEQKSPAFTKSLVSSKTQETPSNVRINLRQGKIRGHVKKLMQGSTFDIDTPVGVAGIRGTTFVCEVLAIAGGAFEVLFGIGEGSAIFTDLGGKVKQVLAKKNIIMRIVKDAAGNPKVQIDASRADLTQTERKQLKSLKKAIKAAAKRVWGKTNLGDKQDGGDDENDGPPDTNPDNDVTDESGKKINIHVDLDL